MTRTMISSSSTWCLKSLCQLIIKNFFSFLVVVAVPLTTTILLNDAQHLVRLHALRPIHLILAASLAAAAITNYLMNRARTAYIIDYACFKAKGDLRIPMATFIEHMHLMPFHDEKAVRFMSRVLERSGLGDETCLPSALFYIPPIGSFSEARAEAESVIFSTIDDLFLKTSIDPNAIDILIVNCSIFSPTPAYSDMIINKYKLRSDIHSVHLSGMGCSAGLISVGLAQNLLQTAPCGAHALVVSTETLSDIHYKGKKRAMQLANILFRMGAAAVLLSNSKEKARFQLKHLLRTITSDQENAYRCVFLEEDEEGNTGINLSKDIIAASGNSLKAALTAIGSLVLPTSEKLRYVLSYITHKVFNYKCKLYVPDFRMAFEHFCIHAGGPAVIDAVQHNLGLLDVQAEPSRMTLHRFGNTSSSTLWYELAYIEATGRMKEGDRVLMIGFGSGYKCNIAVWECIQPASCTADGPWTEGTTCVLWKQAITMSY
ncbi:hypothetical protein ACP70R_028207 [Stipagrostis hirtigluma subsp. patula]